MIDEHKDSRCRIFFCYRAEGSETAKYMKAHLKSVPNKDYGRIWYSDDENVGNYNLDIPILIGQAEIFVLFLARGFTDYFLTPDKKANLHGYDNNLPCITVKEICEIEKQRQKRNISILTVNIDHYCFTDEDLDILKCVFEDVGILREDTISFYSNLNRNIYLRRQTDFSSFTDRILRGLEEKEIFAQPTDAHESLSQTGLTIIEEAEYRKYFQALFQESKYPIIKFFGYTGEVLSSDLLSYAARYSLNTELRILQRNYVIEAKDEADHNGRMPPGIRPWDKAKAIKQMCYETWNYSLKRVIKYYSHQPILKGCLFCNEAGRAIVGFVNFQKWEQFPPSGGSVFKSVPSDMIMINPRENRHCEILLERLNSQFEYEWNHALTVDEMKQYEEKGQKMSTNKRPKTLILDFDRTLAYLYRDTQLLTELAQIMCNYYKEFVEVDPVFYTLDGYKSWHQLHRIVNDAFDYEEAFDINNNAERLVTEFEMRVVSNTPFFDKAVETLKRLSAEGVELIIVSSNATKIIKHALKREGILEAFTRVMGRPIPFDPDKIKPSPYPIEQALKTVSSEKRAVWYVGDDVIDVDSAKACGIVSVGVASGRHTIEQLKDRGADYVIDSIVNIFDLL